MHLTPIMKFRCPLRKFDANFKNPMHAHYDNLIPMIAKFSRKKALGWSAWAKIIRRKIFKALTHITTAFMKKVFVRILFGLLKPS